MNAAPSKRASSAALIASSPDRSLTKRRKPLQDDYSTPRKDSESNQSAKTLDFNSCSDHLGEDKTGRTYDNNSLSPRTLSQRARSIFSPVFSPVLSFFKNSDKKLVCDANSKQEIFEKLESVDEICELDKDAFTSEAYDLDEKSTGSSITTISTVLESADEDSAIVVDDDRSKKDEKDDSLSTLASEYSDSDLDEDFDEFDPFDFIKNLPPLERVQAEPNGLPVIPMKLGNAPSVSLVLDLDETLVHASLEFMEQSHLQFDVTFKEQDYHVWVKIRPHCLEFLERLAEKFEIIVFTASQSIYADKLLNLIDPDSRLIKHRVFRNSCLFVNENYVKDLTVLNRDLSKIAIVDNSPQAFGYQLSNGIPIKSWFGDTSDRCLLKLLPFIESLAAADDVRPHIVNRFKLHERVSAL
mmetsp:Transcript_21680/g.71724  ORF Transcript_21680/g.71724 Transcript_21680/m.71724 type:complete len:412 (-) Transcript_21680:183-1418(-)